MGTILCKGSAGHSTPKLPSGPLNQESNGGSGRFRAKVRGKAPAMVLTPKTSSGRPHCVALTLSFQGLGSGLRRPELWAGLSSWVSFSKVNRAL